jgi:hypothetical protein
MKELGLIQQELKAPKSQTNAFGKYKYRSLEDILEALKPIMAKHKCFLIINDEIILVGERYYVKATATLHNDEGQSLVCSALAREDNDKKGMDLSQLTGATSSYARKYALNGLFAIDDTKDADATNEHGNAPQQVTQPPRKINPIEIENLMALVDETQSDIEKMCANYKVKIVGDLTITQYQDAIKKLQAKKGK